MPTYSYKCKVCGNETELVIPISMRNDKFDCEDCGLGCLKRLFDAPRGIKIGKVFNIEGRSNEFWNRAEKVRVEEQSKRVNEENEKIRYGDKDTVAKLERTHTNLVNVDAEPDKIVEARNKLDKIK